MMENSSSLTFRRVKEFEKEFKKLKKKYRSLEDDLARYEKILKGLFPKTPPGSERISRLGNKIKVPIYKEKHFYCECLNKGSRSGLRIIYAIIEDQMGIVFIELYHHNKKDNADIKRIQKYFEDKEV